MKKLEELQQQLNQIQWALDELRGKHDNPLSGLPEDLQKHIRIMDELDKQSLEMNIDCNNDLNTVPEKEPNLKLNEEWQTFKHGAGYYSGAKDMQRAIYERALEFYRVHSWDVACYHAIEEMKKGKIKPPKQQ